MKQWSHFRILVVTIFMVLAMSAMWTVPALADDATPPPPAATEVAPPPDSSAPVEAAPTDASVTEVAPAEASPTEPAATEVPVTEASPTEPAPTEAPVVDAIPPVEEHAPRSQAAKDLLAHVPDNTDVVILDESGAAVPLASQEAADIIYSGDPMWCPLGVTPGGAGCSPSGNTSFQTLINWLTTNDPGKAGVIWIEKNYDSSTAVGDGAVTNFTLDGATLVNMASFSLALKGGWNGAGTTINTTDPSVFDGDSLSIINWNGDVTLSDIMIVGAAGNGLTVETTKNISLTRVKSNNNSGAGAYLDNTVNSGTGNVTVTSSEFNNSTGWYGLLVHSNGTITLSTVTANGNWNGGAWLTNCNWSSGACTTPTIKPVIVNGTNVFNNNGSDGLDISSKGAITLSNITANGNGTDLIDFDGAGAWLYNSYSGSSAGITLTGINTFSGNHYTGVIAYSNGAITLSNVTSELSSTGGGALLDNRGAASAMNVSLISGALQFNGNAGLGLEIYSKGLITLKDISANTNGAGGAFLDNTSGSLGVTLTGTNIFSENGGRGLDVRTDGAITASNLVANSNAGRGAWLDNCQAFAGPSGCTTATVMPVTITGSNQFKFNTGGLLVLSNGAVTLNNITSMNNSVGTGVWIDNSSSPVGANVTLTGTNLMSDNNSAGLFIVSKGIVTLSNLTAGGNGFGDPDTGYGVYIENINATSPKAVNLTGVNDISYNNLTDLYVISKGTITLSNLTVNGSQSGVGAWLDNTFALPSAPQNVTLLGYLNANNNYGSGFNVWSYGVISLINATANDNGWGSGGTGVYLDNQGGTLPKAVTVAGYNNFYNNQWDGMYITSLGAITINNVSAGSNWGYGVYLQNDWLGAVGGITVTNAPTYGSNFSNNGNSGIEAYSRGNIILKDLDADGNGGYGAYLDNTSGAASTVTVGTSRLHWCNGFNDNFYSGLEVYSNASVILSNLCTGNNGYDDPADPSDIPYGYGLKVDNSTAATPQNVTLLGSNSFNWNYSGGVSIYTKGAILANNVTANDNRAGTGALFGNNTNPALPQNITLNGYGDFNGNGGRGLDVSTYGLVTLNSVYADTNSSHGIYVDNFTGATQVKGVTINGYANTYSNGGTGLFILSKGAILVNNLDAWNNTTGVSLNNNVAGAVGGVTIAGHAWASGSSSYGLWVQTLGAITIANLSTWDNGSFGALLDNANPGAVSPVLLTGYADAGNNGGNGLSIESNRAITVSNLYADSNDGTGVFLNNTFSNTPFPQNVTINVAGQFYNNGYNGLVVWTYGAITATNLTANDNGWDPDTFTGYGAYLDNYLGSGITAKSITLNGTNSFDGNDLDGLYVVSLGSIKINNLAAHWNSEDGAKLDNQWDFSNQNVSLTGTNFLENNGFGLDVFSNGLITISNLNANWNLTGGASLDNYSLTATPVSVTLTGSNRFEGNSDGNDTTHAEDGLVIYTDGNITINNLAAKWNDGDGAYLDNWNYWDRNTSILALPDLKLTGVNVFVGNTGTGLYFGVVDTVDITKITADWNGDGVIGYAGGNITLTCGSMTNNAGYGWRLSAWDAPNFVTLKGVFAYGNGTNTALIAGTPVTVRTCPLP